MERGESYGSLFECSREQWLHRSSLRCFWYCYLQLSMRRRAAYNLSSTEHYGTVQRTTFSDPGLCDNGKMVEGAFLPCFLVLYLLTLYELVSLVFVFVN